MYEPKLDRDIFTWVAVLFTTGKSKRRKERMILLTYFAVLRETEQ